MRPFQLDSKMKSMRGVFYPTDWMLLMFPSEQQARDAGRRLDDAGLADGDVLLLSPEDIQRDIADSAGDDAALPSAGTEGDTVRRFAELADQGHYGVMVHAPHADDAERVKAALAGAKISYGQTWRKLIIEDVVS